MRELPSFAVLVVLRHQRRDTSLHAAAGAPGQRSPPRTPSRQPTGPGPLDGQASPLVIGEPQPPPAELLAKDAVLLAQEVDDLELVAEVGRQGRGRQAWVHR